jgi:hypothetical protein
VGDATPVTRRSHEVGLTLARQLSQPTLGIQTPRMTTAPSFQPLATERVATRQQSAGALYNQLTDRNRLATHCISPRSPREAFVTTTTKPDPPKQIDVWVRKWVDYSSKYGVGYILSNGCTGVYFNDATKIISTVDKTRFLYIERRKFSE